MIKKNLLQMIGIGVGGLVLGFVLGATLGGGDSQTPDIAAMRGGFAQGGEQGGQRKVQMGGGASGEILSVDAKSITIKMRDGGSRIVFYTSSTPVYKSIAGTGADLKIGSQISTFGNSGTDGSIIAESIQIRDSFGVPGIPLNK